jgi:homoserine kinase
MESATSRRFSNILELPKQLQVTILALIKLGSSTATSVAAVTGKARAVESLYLNQLVVMKLVNKERRHADILRRGCCEVFFTVDLEALDW